MRTSKRQSALSLARRAGALAVGFDAAAQMAAKGTAALVLLAQDASPGTCKRVHTACRGRCEVLRTRLTKAEIGQITSKPAGVVALGNNDMATLFKRAANEEEPD